MTKIERFEGLEIGQIAREFVQVVYEITHRKLMNPENNVKWQIRKTSGSIMDNIAEGFERDGKNEFIQFFSIAKGSLG